MSLAPPQPPAYELMQTPSYAALPRIGEQRLAFSGRMPHRTMRSGTLEKRTKRLVLALYEQRTEGDVPVFDRGGWLSGCVGLLERAQEVQKVEIKVRTLYSRRYKVLTAAPNCCASAYCRSRGVCTDRRPGVGSDTVNHGRC